MATLQVTRFSPLVIAYANREIGEIVCCVDGRWMDTYVHTHSEETGKLLRRPSQARRFPHLAFALQWCGTADAFIPVLNIP